MSASVFQKREADLLGPLFADPNAAALDALRRRAICDEATAERHEAKAVESRAHADASKALYERALAAVAAGESIALSYPMDSLDRDYARDAQQIYIDENEDELATEKKLAEEAFARLGLDEHGFRFPTIRVGALHEQIIFTRVRRHPRKRLDRSTIVAAIEGALRASVQAVAAGRPVGEAAAGALQCYREGIGDLGVPQIEKRTRLYWALEASRKIVRSGQAIGLPEPEIVRRRDHAVAMILPEGCNKLELSTGPPD
jgi:hypothetical protein